MVVYREVCPEGVQNKCPGGVWCRGFMSWGDTLILVISRGVQLRNPNLNYLFTFLTLRAHGSRGCCLHVLRMSVCLLIWLFTNFRRGL